MGISEHRQLRERLSELERTILSLNNRVRELQRELDQGHVTRAPTFAKQSCWGSLFKGWKQNGTSIGMVRQNRRVERHASLF